MSISCLITIILPVYNAEKYLKSSLTSLLCQTLRDIEIICVDDGSIDGSLAILEEYAAFDPRITVLTQENCGSGAARNLALREAHGEYISFLDADDCYASETCLQELYDAAKRMNVSICGGLRQMLQPDGTITLHSLFRQELARKPHGMKISYEDFQYDFHYHNFIFRKDLLTNNNIEFPLYRRFQDPPFLSVR